MQTPRVSEAILQESIDVAGSPEKAAAILGVSRRTVYRWMEHYGMRLTPRLDKRCTECGEWKPVDEFYRLNTGKPRPSCRSCYKARIRTYKRENRAKSNAHKTVGNAVKAGKLTPPDRCACGSNGRLNAHHADYSRPLDVEWLCGKCHTARHAQTAAEAA